VATTSLANTSNSTLPGWSTYADPTGSYTIQYPATFGRVTVRPDTDGTDLTWDPYGDAGDLLVYIGLDTPTERRWLKGHAELTFQNAYISNDLVVQLYAAGGGNERAAVSISGNPTAQGYFIVFECDEVGMADNCSLPPEWRQMLSTFRLVDTGQ
jgi:hypothetical protein